MLTFLKRLAWDEAAFERWGRMLLFAVGQGMAHGTIPTGVEGGGKFGWALSLIAFLVGAGDKNKP